MLLYSSDLYSKTNHMDYQEHVNKQHYSGKNGRELDSTKEVICHPMG